MRHVSEDAFRPPTSFLTPILTLQETIEMLNGCVCCTGKHTHFPSALKKNLQSGASCLDCKPLLTLPKKSYAIVLSAVRGDLIRVLTKLLRRKSRFDAILIETTGTWSMSLFHVPRTSFCTLETVCSYF